MIYLDNNATTMMSHEAKQEMVNWCNKGNPSSGYAAAGESRAMMNELRALIGKLCGIDTCCAEARDNGAMTESLSSYKVIFTSGASEANCFALGQIIAAYQHATGHIPHVVMSAIEHKSLFEMMNSYVDRGLATCTFVAPTPSGHIYPLDVEKAIRSNTALVVVMHANNETGAINDIDAIGRIAHASGIPFHCDTVQTFGKEPVDVIAASIDSFCISFHKFGGPPGVGALCIKSALVAGYKIAPMIFGTQMMGLRGGTENIPGLGASLAACRLTMSNRAGKNRQIAALRDFAIDEIKKQIPHRMYSDYLGQVSTVPREIVFLSKTTQYYSPGIIYLSVVDHTREVCNSKIKDQLAARNIIISIGSACNTASAKASHVLYALRADSKIRRGALRISLGDDNTTQDIAEFVTAFIEICTGSNIYK